MPPIVAVPLCALLCQVPAKDPRYGEVPLPAENGWRAQLALDLRGLGIWTVRAYPVFPQYGTPEVVGLDDEGVCHVLVSYSGKWSPRRAVHDGGWLGGLAHGDLDPRVPGAELYTGGRQGRLYQVLPHEGGNLSALQIAVFPGLEIHTLALGDVDPEVPGRELYVFTRPGRLYRVRPAGPRGFERTELARLPGRYRDALLLPAKGGGARILAPTRAGSLDEFRIRKGRVHRRTLLRVPMGLGRIAAQRVGGRWILYVTADDGRLYRLAEGSGGAFERTLIYAGPQGLRGVAAGRFSADPQTETVAVFGYDRKVRLLSKPPRGGWHVETIFEDRAAGHALSAAELDGRNATRELIGSGYAGRIFVLARPPGYGLPGVATPAAVRRRRL